MCRMNLSFCKLVLAIGLLLCLAPMPYSYYSLIRFSGMIFFVILAYRYYLEKREVLTIIFIVLALLFQPFAKIALERGVWNVIDVVVAIFLLFLRYNPKR